MNFLSLKGKGRLIKRSGFNTQCMVLPIHYIFQPWLLKQNAFLPHLWQKIIGNSKGEGSLKPVISNQLGSAWKTTFPKLMVPILCNNYCFTWHPETSKLHYLSRNSFPFLSFLSFQEGGFQSSTASVEMSIFFWI